MIDIFFKYLKVFEGIKKEFTMTKWGILNWNDLGWFPLYSLRKIFCNKFQGKFMRYFLLRFGCCWWKNVFTYIHIFLFYNFEQILEKLVYCKLERKKKMIYFPRCLAFSFFNRWKRFLAFLNFRKFYEIN